MACSIFFLGGKPIGFACGPRRPQSKCHYCSRPSSNLCDFPAGDGKTCDRPICGQCMIHTGPDRDECRVHNFPPC